MSQSEQICAESEWVNTSRCHQKGLNEFDNLPLFMLRIPFFEVMRRYTAVRIAIGLVMLQSAFAIFNFLCWVLREGHAWATIGHAYSAPRIALWLLALAWSAVSLASVVAFRNGDKRGRLAYVCGAAIWVAAAFALAPWQVALSGVCMPLVVSCVLFSRTGGRYLLDELTRQRDGTVRGRSIRVAWVVNTAYYYALFWAQLTNAGWFAELLPDRRRAFAILAMPLLTCVAFLCTRKGERIWRLGLFIAISGTAGLFALVGYVPYTRLVARYLGPGYQGYAVPWELSTMWVAFLLLSGFVLLLSTRLRYRHRNADISKTA